MSEAWPVIDAITALKRIKEGAVGIDVRSPREFSRGAIAAFANLPLLNDEHRHLVGLKYKHEGQAAAVQLGHQLVDPLRPELVRRWMASISEVSNPDLRLVICWRGGLRSQIVSEWLASAGVRGVRVTGGYKALRHELLLGFENPPPLLVLSGLTGSGKTEVLRAFPSHRVLDLEELACHRGSSFGGFHDLAQPPQQTFENGCALGLYGTRDEILLEDESRRIGTCVLPNSLYEAMGRAPCVVIEELLEKRVQRIYKEYVERPLSRSPKDRVQQSLLDALERLSRRLGGLRTGDIREKLTKAFASPEPSSLDTHAGWIECLLTQYYDSQYEYALRRQARDVLFRGSHDDVKNFLAHRFDRRRS